MYKIQKRRWFSLSVFIFHHVFHCSLSTAWKPSVMLLPFHRRNTQAAPSISPPKTARIPHSNHRRNEVLTFRVRRRELNCKAYLFFWVTEDSLNILLKTCLSFDTLHWVFDTWRQSLSVLQTKWDVKAFPVPLFIYKPAQYCINEIFELTKSCIWEISKWM